MADGMSLTRRGNVDGLGSSNTGSGSIVLSRYVSHFDDASGTRKSGSGSIVWPYLSSALAEKGGSKY